MMSFLFLLISSASAQGLVTEFQDAPIGDSKQCAIYRESRKYSVELANFLRFPGMAQVKFMENGDIYLNRRMEDHLPYKTPPLPATVLHRYTIEGTHELFPFQTKSKAAQSLVFGRFSVSVGSKFAVSVADRTMKTTEFKVVLLTDLTTKNTTEIFTQGRAEDNQVSAAFVLDDGRVMIFFDDGKRMMIKNGVRTNLNPVPLKTLNWGLFTSMELVNSDIVLYTKNRDFMRLDASGSVLIEERVVAPQPEVSFQDFTGVKTSQTTYQVDGMNYISDVRRLSFYELGQEVGSMELSGCNFKFMEQLNPRSTRVVCEEGIYWLVLDANNPVSDVNRNFAGFRDCR